MILAKNMQVMEITNSKFTKKIKTNKKLYKNYNKKMKIMNKI